MIREYIYQHLDRAFIWLLVDTETDEPVGGGTTASYEKATECALKARNRLAKAGDRA